MRVTSSSAAPVYLVSAAGVPNLGDELIARAWLDWLARAHPRVEVWLDCVEPGRAAHLLDGVHPRVRFTNTLWQLTHHGPDAAPDADEPRIRAIVRELGSPRIDAGLTLLRATRSVHFLGGGYLNAVWRRNLGMLVAASELRRGFGVPAFATGQGFLPQSDDSAAWVSALLREFDFVESRDAQGARRLGVRAGLDDAFLALGNERPVASAGEAPEVMILIQGDLGGADEDELFAAVAAFLGRQPADARIGLVEALPPDDARILARLREHRPGIRFYPFSEIWADGLPARPGQTWLTTRFHVHLLAAAVGARGAALSLHPGYYDVKHASLVEVGTGWGVSSSPRRVPAASADPLFPARVPGLAARKRRIAEGLYPRVRVTGLRSALRRMTGDALAAKPDRAVIGAQPA